MKPSHEGLGDIVYEIRRSRRRTLGLRIDAGGAIIAQAPWWAPRHAVQSFVRRHLAWIRRTRERLAKRGPVFVPRFEEGEAFPLWGEPQRLCLQGGAGRHWRCSAGAGQLILQGPVAASGALMRRRAILRFYRATLEEKLRDLLPPLAQRLGREPCRVSVGFARHRWGSCSQRGHLRFNARLAMMPPALLEYVIVHELAHLREPNHQPPFWALVQSLLPDYRQRRKELRQLGAYLTL